MKILFTSIGRRVELVQSFRSAAANLNIDLKILGVDISMDAPALYFCDATYPICRISEEAYIPQLLDICKDNQVDCLIPTIDTDLMLLAQSKRLFEEAGIRVLISAPDKVRLCRDKTCTGEYFRSVGLNAPLSISSLEEFDKRYERREIAFPVFIKPKDGSSSIDAYKAENYDRLCQCAQKIRDYVIQQFISGREYTIDIFCDYWGNPVFITPRERILVRGGEVIVTKITQNDRMIAEMQTLISDFKPCGQITVQLIRDEQSGEDYYIEINPRFGGGAPLSIKAGADSAEAVLRMLSGERLSYQEKAARDGAIYSRFDQSICLNP